MKTLSGRVAKRGDFPDDSPEATAAAWARRVYGHDNVLGLDLVAALIRAERQRERRRAARRARVATLPAGYQWGDDAVQAFNFGKECAAEAILGTRKGK